MCVLHVSPSFPRGWLEEVRQDPNHRASWVGGAREMEGEQEGRVSPATEASAPWAGPAHLQKRCLFGTASQEMVGWGAMGFSRFSVQLPLEGAQWERAAGS